MNFPSPRWVAVENQVYHQHFCFGTGGARTKEYRPRQEKGSYVCPHCRTRIPSGPLNARLNKAMAQEAAEASRKRANEVLQFRARYTGLSNRYKREYSRHWYASGGDAIEALLAQPDLDCATPEEFATRLASAPQFTVQLFDRIVEEYSRLN